MNPTRDKFIVEWFGECWHDAEGYSVCDGWSCSKCGESHRGTIAKNLDLSTWQDFGWLWGKMRNYQDATDLWFKFMAWLGVKGWTIIQLIDNPDHFADAVEKFLQSQGKEER